MAFVMMDEYSQLLQDLLQFFVSESYTILGATGSGGYRSPSPLPNDGYGDQQLKTPDVYAYDEINKRYIVGVVKTGEEDLESSHSLTQYDVFFDHKNPENGKASRVCFILPSHRIADFTAIITHYIHPDYWENLAIVRPTSKSATP